LKPNARSVCRLHRFHDAVTHLERAKPRGSRNFHGYEAGIREIPSCECRAGVLRYASLLIRRDSPGIRMACVAEFIQGRKRRILYWAWDFSVIRFASYTSVNNSSCCAPVPHMFDVYTTTTTRFRNHTDSEYYNFDRACTGARKGSGYRLCSLKRAQLPLHSPPPARVHRCTPAHTLYSGQTKYAQKQHLTTKERIIFRRLLSCDRKSPTLVCTGAHDKLQLCRRLPLATVTYRYRNQSAPLRSAYLDKGLLASLLPKHGLNTPISTPRALVHMLAAA
jgi:hypothetical protein